MTHRYITYSLLTLNVVISLLILTSSKETPEPIIEEFIVEETNQDPRVEEFGYTYEPEPEPEPIYRSSTPSYLPTEEVYKKPSTKRTPFKNFVKKLRQQE